MIKQSFVRAAQQGEYQEVNGKKVLTVTEFMPYEFWAHTETKIPAKFERRLFGKAVQTIPQRIETRFFVSPEKMVSKVFLKIIELPSFQQRLKYIVVDEVHCLSSWSYNFRPLYLKIFPFACMLFLLSFIHSHLLSNYSSLWLNRDCLLS